MSSDRPAYPKRESHFAHRFVRVLHKSCAAQDIGPAACYMLCVIAHTEDAGRYAGPARFWNSQMMETLGLRSPKQLNTARERAVAAGWLIYYREGTRAVGEYMVCIPPRFSRLSDAPLESAADHHIRSAGGTNNGKNHQNGDGGFVPNLTQEGDGKRNEKVTESGKPPIPIPVPIPTSCPTPVGGDLPPGKKRSSGTTTRITPDDLAVAEWMWSLILDMQPGRKLPKLDQWANTIRLLRECDGRTHDQIRELFGRVSRDTFWRKNVVSPDKLRDKWDDLQLKLPPSAGANGSAYREISIPPNAKVTV